MQQCHVHRRRSIPLVYLVFLAVGLVLLPFYRFELSPDGISYVSIATEYARGAWSEALNAYWSPLESWLIAVLLLIRIPPITAAKLVTLAAGVLALASLRRLLTLLEMSPVIRRLCLFAGAAMALGFVFEENTPDLLFTALILLYLGIIFDPVYPARRNAGLLCGLIGIFVYLAKAYGFFFFVAHFVLFTAIYWLRSDNRTRRTFLLRHFLIGSLVFCLGTGIWSTALHAKYGIWTTGTAANYNFRLVGPESDGYPHLRHLIPPPSAHAVNAWQDPLRTALPSWRITDGSSTIMHELKILTRNVKLIGGFWYHTTPLWVGCFLGYIVVSLSAASRRLEWADPLITVLILSAGYSLVSVESRYFWLTDFLLLWITFRTLDPLVKSSTLTPLAANTLGWAVTLSFLIAPILALRSHFLADKNLYVWSQELKRNPEIKGNLASCADWPDSAYVAYQLGLPYYGVTSSTPAAEQVASDLNPDYHGATKTRSNIEEIEAALSRAPVNYLFIWPDCGLVIPGGSETLVTAGNLKLMRLDRGPKNRDRN